MGTYKVETNWGIYRVTAASTEAATAVVEQFFAKAALDVIIKSAYPTR